MPIPKQRNDALASHSSPCHIRDIQRSPCGTPSPAVLGSIEDAELRLTVALTDGPKTWAELQALGLNYVTVLTAMARLVRGGGYCFHVGPDLIAFEQLG